MLENGSSGWKRTRKTDTQLQVRTPGIHDQKTVVSIGTLTNITGPSLNASYDQAVKEGADPRIMLINSPSNPTGQVFSEETLDTIARFCQDRRITLITDEIYSDVCFNESSQRGACTASRFNDGQMILTGGLSKVCFDSLSRLSSTTNTHLQQTYSAGGWRVGFAIFPNTEFGMTVQKTILAYASECWSAASAPAQEAAAVAFDITPEMDLYRQQVVSLHQRCTVRLFQALRECGLAVPEPKGAFYVYPSFHPYTRQLQALGIRTSLDLSRWLIEEYGVAALPGSAFGEDDNGLHGGRYRLRMATSYLYFRDAEERYTKGYELLEQASRSGSVVELPLLDEAIAALKKAVAQLKDM